MRKLVSLPREYDQKLKMVSEKLGISQSEVIRRALDEYLQKIGLSVVLEE